MNVVNSLNTWYTVVHKLPSPCPRIPLELSPRRPPCTGGKANPNGDVVVGASTIRHRLTVVCPLSGCLRSALFDSRILVWNTKSGAVWLLSAVYVICFRSEFFMLRTVQTNMYEYSYI